MKKVRTYLIVIMMLCIFNVLSIYAGYESVDYVTLWMMITIFITAGIAVMVGFVWNELGIM